jgi:hypothetical protein|nr:MAG TPA: hypothetical protein [Caudoviricetes sp.]
MKYRLKDRKLQKRLEELFDCFGSNLNDAVLLAMHKAKVERLDDIPNDYKIFVECWVVQDDGNTLTLGDGFGLTKFMFSSNAVVCEYEYNPTQWNAYPAATPPKGADMRVECANGEGRRAFFYGDGWRVFGTGAPVNGVVRFRPWE